MPQTAEVSNQNQVARLAELGWCLIPMKLKTKNPGTLFGENWQHQASNDPQQIQAWLEQYGTCNWGVLLGPKSGVIDVEDDSPEGRAILDALMAENETVTPCYSSGKSIHRIFSYDARIANQSATVVAAYGTEWRFGTDKAAQSVIPPSVHESGKRYQWLPGLSPDDVAVARLPDSMWQGMLDLKERQRLEKQNERAAKRQRKTVVPCSSARPLNGQHTKHVPAAEELIEQRSWDDLLTAEGWKHYEGDDWTRPGDDWSNAKSASICQNETRLHVWTNAGPIDDGHYSKWRFWYQSHGFTDHEQIDAAREFLGTERSGKIDMAFKTTAPQQKATNDSADDDEMPPITDRTYHKTDLNDIGNARHYSRRYGDDLRFCFAWKKWLCWDDARWKLDDSGTPLRLAKNLVTEMFRDAQEVLTDQAFKHVCESASASRLEAMVRLAGPDLPIRLDEMDTDPWVLNCVNGTVDLTSGELYPHRRNDHLTKLCPTTYYPDASAGEWMQFLHDVFAGDIEIIQFLQRLFGYCLTGDVREQKLPLFYGGGANGKSTLLNAFLECLGPDYSMQSMPDFLMEKRGESHPTEKASLFGKRFVACTETEANRKLAESTVKMLTGGEKIMARRMREDFWEFDPTHKLILCTNHRPLIRGTDHGIWRRLLLVPFEQRFEGARQDKSLPDKLKTEACGILAWAVRGCLEWQRIGLNPPDSITIATNDYRCGENVFGRFVEDCCISQAACSVRFKDLFDRFETWCADGGEELLGKKALGTYLEEAGYTKYSANGRCYRGLMLKPE